MGWDAKSGLKLGISLPQVTYILVISQQVRLWLASLPRGQACLRTECSGVFQNGNFSPHPARSKTEFFFFDIYCGNLVKLLEVNLRQQWGLCKDRPYLSHSQRLPRPASGSMPATVQYPALVSAVGRFHSSVSVPVNYCSLYSL